MIALRVATSPGEWRVATIEDGRLAAYRIWRPGAPDGVGDLHRGRVLRRVPAMAGLFVALDAATGFLPDGAGGAGLGEGDMLAVRITRASQGGKGPRLAAVPASCADAQGPVRRLAPAPDPARAFRARHPDAPILFDDPGPAARAGLAGVEIERPVFDAALEAEIACLAEPDAALGGGLRATFSPTPALTAIDIDTADGTETGLPAAQNLAALPALARQVRLRDLGGAILIDWAGLAPKRRRVLGPPLAAVLATDPVRPRLLGFTALGLAEIVRPRIHPPLHELLAGPHAAALAALRAWATRRAPGLLRAAPALCAALDRDEAARADLAARGGHPLIRRCDPSLAPWGWAIDEVPPG